MVGVIVGGNRRGNRNGRGNRKGNRNGRGNRRG